MNHVYVAGSINMDVIATAVRYPKMGETVLGREILFFPGGKGSNQAVSAAKLGSRTDTFGTGPVDYRRRSQTILGVVSNAFRHQASQRDRGRGGDAADADSLAGVGRRNFVQSWVEVSFEYFCNAQAKRWLSYKAGIARGPSLVNTPKEVDATLRIIHAMAFGLSARLGDTPE
jgi:pfkB family carbohydrate kinase